MMSDRRIVITIKILVILGVGQAVIGSVLWITNGYAGLWYSDYAAFFALWVLVLGVIVWLVVGGQPYNPVVWILAASALFGGAYVLTNLIAALISGDPVTSITFDGYIPAEFAPSAARMKMMVEPLWIVAAFPPATFGILLFPDGRLPSPRWRWVGLLALAALSLSVVGFAWMLRPLADSPASERIDLSPAGMGILLGLVSAALCLLGLLARLRASRGELRQQLKWIVWGSSIAVIGLSIAMVSSETRFEEFGPAFGMVVAVPVFAGSYGVAIAKYRLYDIDVVISRSLVFGAMAAFITLVYSVIVVGLGTMIGRGQGWVLPITATAVVAVAFEPVRQRAQRWANRLVFGRRATPFEVLSDLTEKLAGSEHGEGLLMRLAGLLGSGTGAARATVWLGSDPMVAGASWPAEVTVENAVDFGADNVFPVRHDGEIVGALEVVKPRGAVLTHSERALVADLAGSAALVIGYQRLNDSLIERAKEMELSRRRLVDAQDEERRRLERELHDGAQQQIADLRTKIAHTRRIAEQEGAADLERLLAELEEECDAALEEVRSLAKGLYPLVLESEGLAAAVTGLATSTPVDVEVTKPGVGRYPPEVEAAVYFDISEAVTNAVKHGKPPIRIGLDESDGVLSFQVTDAGPGFDPATANGGAGLVNMGDRLDAVGGRLTIISRPGEPTSVSGEIPLPAIPA